MCLKNTSNPNAFEKSSSGTIECLGEFLADICGNFCQQFEEDNQYFIFQTLKSGGKSEYYNS